jgi:hypothetical protein
MSGWVILQFPARKQYADNTGQISKIDTEGRCFHTLRICIANVDRDLIAYQQDVSLQHFS